MVFATLVLSGRVTMLGISRWAGQGGSQRTVQRLFPWVLPWAIRHPTPMRCPCSLRLPFCGWLSGSGWHDQHDRVQLRRVGLHRHGDGWISETVTITDSSLAAMDSAT